MTTVPETATPPGACAQGGGAFPYDEGWIPIDGTWQRLLTNRANTLNFGIELARDARDNQIAPTRGDFVRLAGLFAWEFGGARTRVLAGEVEARNYLRIRPWLVWAHALRGLVTGSLRRDRYLPQDYWIQLGGEGSVRGVNRDAIGAVGGGRAGINLRNELRLHWRQAGLGQVGLVVFWDRAGVWRRPRPGRLVEHGRRLRGRPAVGPRPPRASGRGMEGPALEAVAVPLGGGTPSR